MCFQEFQIILVRHSHGAKMVKPILQRTILQNMMIKIKESLRGYPKKTALRWPNMPPLIDAIFTLPFNLGDGETNKPTYVISGERSYFINPSNDKV